MELQRGRSDDHEVKWIRSALNSRHLHAQLALYFYPSERSSSGSVGVPGAAEVAAAVRYMGNDVLRRLPQLKY